MILLDVPAVVAAQRPLVLDNHVVEALAPDGGNHAFNERSLPGRVGRGEDVVDAGRHGAEPPAAPPLGAGLPPRR